MSVHSIRVSADKKRLEKFDTVTGAMLKSRDAEGTEVVQVLEMGVNFVIREDFYNFPAGKSNVYCVDIELRTLWNAELPSQNDIFANPVSHSLGVLHCASWDCYACDIDPINGKILQQRFTK